MKNRINYKALLTMPKLERTFTAEELWQYIQTLGVISNNKNSAIIRLLCLYFASDERFITQASFSLEKGIALMGNIGVGKTFLLKSFTSNPRLGFITVSSKNVALEFRQKDNDLKTIQKYSNYSYSRAMNQLTGSNKFTWMFDDFGNEANVNNYGNEANVLCDILEEVYNHKIIVHLTTNLTAKDILDRYGERLLDRMIQMFNFIEFPIDSPSMRE